MSDHIDFAAFRDELQKTASFWRAARRAGHRALGGIGSGAAFGAAAGGAIGSGVGGVREYRRAKRDGAEPDGAALRGLTGALRGATRGALIGGAVGGAGLGALNAAKLGPSASAIASRKGPLGSVGRFGQRQVHALTGWTPAAGNAAEGRRVLKLRAAETGAARAAAKKALGNAEHPERAARQYARSIKADHAARRAEAHGLSNLPGVAKNLLMRPKKTLKAAVRDQWHGNGAIGKTLLVGLPAAEVASAFSGPKKDREGRGRFARAGSALGSLGMGLGPLPLAGSIAATGALSRGGAALGRLAD